MAFSIADIVGADATVPIVLPQAAMMMQLTITGAAATPARWGGSEVTVSQGATIPAGQAQFLPRKARLLFYQSSEIYVYLPSGLTCSVSCV